MKGYDDREIANIMILFGHFGVVNKDGSIDREALFQEAAWEGYEWNDDLELWQGGN